MSDLDDLDEINLNPDRTGKPGRVGSGFRRWGDKRHGGRLTQRHAIFAGAKSRKPKPCSLLKPQEGNGG